MNDPGLDSPIQDGAKAVEADQNEERQEEEVQAEDEQTFLNPRLILSAPDHDKTDESAVDGGLLPQHSHC